MNILMAGVFDSEADLYNTVRQLKEAGIQAEDISVVSRRVKMLEKLSQLTGTQPPQTGDSSKMVVGILREVAAGFQVLPEPAAVSGPAAERAAGAGIGGGEDSLAKALAGMGIPEDEASWYEKQIEQDQVLVLLACEPAYRRRVSEIFNRNSVVNR
ncbi:general stress protein [Paenibacillus sp. JSM ZJ436]|uniref:general stress protein n=1 Tax=Paenibacillus sp. JSM ZJ436 TaxID=3376190 RepID=UPI00378DE821